MHKRWYESVDTFLAYASLHSLWEMDLLVQVGILCSSVHSSILRIMAIQLIIPTVPDPCLSDPCDANALCEREGLLSENFNCTCQSPFTVGDGFNCSGIWSTSFVDKTAFCFIIASHNSSRSMSTSAL